MNNAIVNQNIDNKFTDEQINLIKDMYAKDTSNEQLGLFMYVAKKTGLDPLAKQIHCVLRKNKNNGKMDMSIQTSIDGYRLIADRTGNLAGIDDAAYDRETSPTVASVTVYKFVKGHKCAFTASARWKEYAPKGTQAFMWEKMPFLMLGKCAESLALRKAFPADLSGVYSDDEMAQADENRHPVIENNIPKTLPDDKSKFQKKSITDKPADKPATKEYICSGKNCGTIINEAVNNFSTRKYGMALCMSCQKIISAPTVSNSTVSTVTSSATVSTVASDKGVDDFEKSLLDTKERNKLK